MEKKNILMVSLDRKILENSSEAQKRMIKYGEYCQSLRIIVFTLRLRSGQARQIAENIWIYPTNSLYKSFYVSDACKIAKEIVRCLKLDVRSLVLSTQDLFETGLAGFFIKSRFGLKWQAQVHTDFLSPCFWQESFLNKIRVLIGKWLVKKADKIRAVSQRIKDSLMKIGVAEEKIFVLPVWVDIEKFLLGEKKIDLRQIYPQNNPIILTAGRLVKVKNISLQIKAVAEIVKKYPQALLVIVGDGPEKERLKSIAKELKIENNIVFVQEDRDMVSYYKSADFFILSSDHEGYGRVTVEAMACGCPVIMTDVGLAGETLKDGENGLVVPVGDRKALTEAIIKMIENKEMREKFIEKGIETVKNLSKEENILPRIFEI